MTKSFQINSAKMRRADAYQKRQDFLRRMQHKLQVKENVYPNGRAHKFSAVYSRWVDALEDESGDRTDYGYRW